MGGGGHTELEGERPFDCYLGMAHKDIRGQKSGRLRLAGDGHVRLTRRNSPITCRQLLGFHDVLFLLLSPEHMEKGDNIHAGTNTPQLSI